MAGKITDLDAALGNIETAIGKLGTDLKAAILDLQNKIAAGATDLTAEIGRASAIAAALTTLDAEAVAADPGAVAAPALTPTTAPKP